MTTKNDLKWRLKELPTAEGVAELVNAKVLKPQEARDILLKEKGDKTEELEERVKFLEELVSTLRGQVHTPVVINYPRQYDRYPWTVTYTSTSTADDYVVLNAASTNNFTAVTN